MRRAARERGKNGMEMLLAASCNGGGENGGGCRRAHHGIVGMVIISCMA